MSVNSSGIANGFIAINWAELLFFFPRSLLTGAIRSRYDDISSNGDESSDGGNARFTEVRLFVEKRHTHESR